MTSIQSRTLMVESDDEEPIIDEVELRFQQLKVAIHEKLVDSLDLSLLAHIAQGELEKEVRVVAEEIVREEAPKLPKEIRSRLLDELFHEVFGLGPLETLMKDDGISDILVNHPHEVYHRTFRAVGEVGRDLRR